ncbi:MAG: metalloregulator ArsR/SmtB family transcription factor [Lentisphaerae bacterium]|nr:metalloregulator ArsR/SmtB family transcription factor [Lentisphaerota bacterium]MBT4823388.1 metalloregulator ArsR/SmtB family transcription factor [Lentisphaerota bacterium]MBT5612251.1 metalloregulator ArsR/SmtB family transcription factor [Lentisphaerota bacterium]MBT7060771.1 metalloregulator ArsR/SmtB family transcription factor [Lentisphaerota bacterium]MBT7845230.1 metalloregulator ArsR/SmtB family transcription factor [Lentisphaerota bacterium]
MDAEVNLLKALAEPTRLRLVVLLALNGETCVCKLAEALEAPQFRISRHLGIMRDRGVVEARREGTWMHYRLVAPRSKLEECLQDCFRDCLANHDTVEADLARLAAADCETN